MILQFQIPDPCLEDVKLVIPLEVTLKKLRSC